MSACCDDCAQLHRKLCFSGQRSADALKEFIRKQLQSTTVSLGEHESLNEKLDVSDVTALPCALIVMPHV